MDRNDEEKSKVRRSGRERTSTVIQIGGHTVLKQNNYVLKGMSYNFNAHQGDTYVRRTVPARKKADAATRKPSKVQPGEAARNKHNKAVKERVTAKAEARMAFLASNLDVLEPFVEEKILAKISDHPSEESNTSEVFQQPKEIQGELRDYQLSGLNWMASMHQRNCGMILGDEMGLGKTLQTISLLAHLKEQEGTTGPSLIICPLSVLYSWCNEFKKWAPSFEVLRFHSSNENERNNQRRALMDEPLKYDAVVTTYEMAKNPALRTVWCRTHFNYCVLDEGHKIKALESQISQSVRGLHCENKLILTGTPLQNNLVELHSLLSFLYPDVFTTSEPFAEAFDLITNSIDKKKLEQAQKLLSRLMLRRLKEKVEKLIPKKIETKVLCPLSSMQIYWYKALLMKDIHLLARASSASDGMKSGQAKQLSNLIMQLRKCCLHPFLFEGAEPDVENTTLSDLVASSGKLAVLDMLLLSLFKNGHRCVLFSQFTQTLDIIEDYCVMRGWKYVRFDGSTSRAMRNFLINQFNEVDSDKFLFLLSTRSGGCGLNLQTADTCILFDSDWNPQPDLQAMARVHRIGQKKTVHVYRLISSGTIEERIVERAEKKLYLDHMVNQGKAATDDSEEGLSKTEILSTLRFGCNAVFGDTDNSLPTTEDIALITDRSRAESFSEGKLKGGVANSLDGFKAEKELTATMQLGGIDFKAIRDQHKKKSAKLSNVPRELSGIANHFRMLTEEKRKRKNRIMMVDGKQSGYGAACVPVLAANNYELETGETSVFSRELKTSTKSPFAVKKRPKKQVDFVHQDFCQVCGDGGSLMLCPRCPVSLHLHCAGVGCAKDFLCCSHHRCVKCGKNSTDAGGLLFPCQSCPNCYCEDCLPPKEQIRILEDCERFDKLGYPTPHQYVYIHCSKICENVAVKELEWQPPSAEPPKCPPPLDISDLFGEKIDEVIEKPDENETGPRLRPRKRKNYKEIQSPAPAQAPIKKPAFQSVSSAAPSFHEDTSRAPVAHLVSRPIHAHTGHASYPPISGHASFPPRQLPGVTQGPTSLQVQQGQNLSKTAYGQKLQITIGATKPDYMSTLTTSMVAKLQGGRASEPPPPRPAAGAKPKTIDLTIDTSSDDDDPPSMLPVSTSSSVGSFFPRSHTGF